MAIATPTKTVNFSPEVQKLLENDFEVTEVNGKFVGKITCTLDRKQYEALNKALEAAGGKWSRKDKGHVFDEDPRTLISGVVENGSITVEKDGFFETPEAVVRRMLELCPIDDTVFQVLEPSAGMGAIARVLVREGVPAEDLTLVERNAKRCDSLDKEFPGVDVLCLDFTEYYELFDRIYMNPPFELGQDIDHVMHACNHCLDWGGQMVAVMSEGPFFRDDKKSVQFREWLDEIGAYTEKLPSGSFKSSGTMVETRLVHITK